MSAGSVSAGSGSAPGERDADARPWGTDVVRLLRQVGIDLVRYYNRLEVRVEEPLPDRPCLLVGNHGFGGIFDLNVFAVLGTLDQLAGERPVTALTHHLAWTLRVGRLLETVGSRPASHRSALDAFAAGHHVLVFPGGDVEASRPFARRHQVTFAGRMGFARLAIETGVPIVPIVTAGAGNTLLVLADGQRLARRLHLDTLLRYKVLPVSLSIPWGLNVGLVGLLPYLPLPAKMRTAVLPAMTAADGEDPAGYATRVHDAMQAAMDQLVRQ